MNLAIEMYPAFPVNFSNTVRPGDKFFGSVTFNGGSSYTLVLQDITQGWKHTVNKSLSGAANSSAEVIAEAPSSSSGVLPLANFGTVNFSNATANGSAIGNSSPVQIDMVDNSGRLKTRPPRCPAAAASATPGCAPTDRSRRGPARSPAASWQGRALLPQRARARS